jgi:hypothetical protein
MPIPKPRKGEEQKEFIARCMVDLKNEYPFKDQRLAICAKQWVEKNS